MQAQLIKELRSFTQHTTNPRDPSKRPTFINLGKEEFVAAATRINDRNVFLCETIHNWTIGCQNFAHTDGWTGRKTRPIQSCSDLLLD